MSQHKRVSMASLVADKTTAVIPEQVAVHEMVQPEGGPPDPPTSPLVDAPPSPAASSSNDQPAVRITRRPARGPVGQPTSPPADKRERWEAEPKATSPTTTISFRAPIELDERLRAYTYHRRALRQDLLCGLLDDFLASKGF